MAIGYLDLSSGASGDMLLAAVCDVLGGSWREDCPWQESGELPKNWYGQISHLLQLEPEGRVEIKRINRGGMSACKIDFYVGQTHADCHGRHEHDDHRHHHHHEHTHQHGHSHSHADSHAHCDQHSHSHSHSDSHHDHSHRGFVEIKKIIEDEQNAGRLSTAAAELALKIFTILGQAEAKVHGTSLEKIHFHEVGAFDSIMDIVGFAAAYSLLGLSELSASAPTLGSGRVNAAHGLLAVPVPAVVEILRAHNIPSSGLELAGECLTPTGAAILAAVVSSWRESSPKFERIIAQGVGAGSREVAQKANIVRLLVAE